MIKKSLLVGNDINNFKNHYTWKNLLNDVKNFCQVSELISISKKKPFPLVYEEIFLRSIKYQEINEIELKRFISEKMIWFTHNEIHESINNMDVIDIMTTNYDFTLESISRLDNKGKINERLYSIFRFYKNNKKKYWHIHGSINSPASINLGYEHYIGQLQQMRNYVVSGTNYKSKLIPKKPLIKRLKSGDIQFDSWIDLFYTSDIHIFGLTLDFVEIDLWWLLTYRARQKYYWKLKIDNEIYYYIPKKYVNSSQHKLDMLQAIGVKTIVIDENNKTSYYVKVLNKINNT